MEFSKQNILGLNITKITMPEILEYFYKNDYNIPKYITVVNVHSTMMSKRDEKYKKAINNSFIALSDGKPISMLGNILYHETKPFFKRITGPYLLEHILDNSAEKRWRHFFYGSCPETIKKIKYVINDRFSEVKADFLSPPYGNLSDEMAENHIAIINKFKPHFIWIGLGAPKQEMFLYNYYKKFKFGILIGVGAGFDYFAGNIKRAPIWMQSLSLEWLYRLIQEPQRLWKRYLITNTKFIFYSIIEIFKRYIQ